MKKISNTYLFSCVTLFVPFSLFSQYTVNGSAVQNTCKCFTLTQPITVEEASVWNNTMIDLNSSFDFKFRVFLGCNNSPGADGVVFVLQEVGLNALGGGGSGLGYFGLGSPSVGVEIDTWQTGSANPPLPWGDPSFDHIGIQRNGNTDHTKSVDVIAPPVQASASNINIEDCQWHIFRVSWDALGKWIRVYFDNVLRIEVQYDLIANVFSASPMVYWGFTGATGGEFNLQQFCEESVFDVQANFTTDAINNTVCYGTPVTLIDSSRNSRDISAYHWDFGDGTTSSLQQPAPHNYSIPGAYLVKMRVTATDGCTTDSISKTITVGAKPATEFTIEGACSNAYPTIIQQADCSYGQVTQWNWLLDGLFLSAQQQPFQSLPSEGPHQLQLFVISNYGCISDTVSNNFFVKPAPGISMSADVSGCVDELLSFNARQTSTVTSIIKWYWSFGNGQYSNLQSPNHAYGQKATYPIKLWAEADNGCISDTVESTIIINKATAFAGNDTIALKNMSFQLMGNGGSTYNWSPPTGLSNANIQNPIVVLQDDVRYLLTVTTAEGCIDTDDIYIKVFKETAIYVPTGFTPNKDGLNDILKPKYIGIKKLTYFRIFNRWGQLVFYTNDLNRGWDGNINGIRQQTGVYVWVIKAEDVIGKEYALKGTSLMIR